MRTTVDIDDQFLLYAKHQAVQQGCTSKQIIEDAYSGPQNPDNNLRWCLS